MTAVLFDPASPVHRLDEPDVTACRKPVPNGAVTTSQHTALLSAHVYKISVCGLCYPNDQMRTQLARSNSGG